MASSMAMFVTAFNRAPTPQESTWLVQWDSSLQSGSMTMRDVAEVMGISPEVQHNETIDAAEESEHPALPPETPTDEIENLNVPKLVEAIETAYQRKADIPTLHWMLEEIEATEGGKDIGQLLVERADADSANPNDVALLEAKTQTAIEYLVKSGWDGYDAQSSADSVGGITRSDVAVPGEEPMAEVEFTEERWAFFTKVRDEVEAAAKNDNLEAAHQEGMSVAQMHILKPLVDADENALTFDVRDTLSALVNAPEWIKEQQSEYALADAENSFEDLTLATRLNKTQIEGLSGASNSDDYVYSIRDSLSAITQAEEGALDGTAFYRLDNTPEAFTDIAVGDRLTEAERSTLDGAENAEDYVYRLKDTVGSYMQAIYAAEDATEDGEAPEDIFAHVDTYLLADDPSSFDGLPVDVISEKNLEVFNGAENSEDFSLIVEDSLAAMKDAPSYVTSNMAGYRLTDDPSAFEGTSLEDQLTPEELALIEGALNSDQYGYGITDSLENLETQGVPGDADSYTISSSPDVVKGITVEDASEEVLDLIAGATNGGDFNIELADTLGNLAGASERLMDATVTYRLTDEEGAFDSLSISDHQALYDLFQGAENASDYVYGVKDSAGNINTAIEEGVDLTMADQVVQEDAHQGASQGIDGVQDTFEMSGTGNGRISNFEIGEDHDILDFSEYRLSAGGADSGESLRYDYIDSLPDSVDVDTTPDVIGVAEALLPNSPETTSEAVAELFVKSRTEVPDGDDIVDRLQVANREAPEFDVLTNRKMIAVAEDNYDGGVSTLWLWEESSNSDSFDGKVQSSEVTQVATLVGTSDADLGNSFNDGYFM